MIQQCAFFIYWFFDTLVVFGKIKVLPNLDMAWVTYRWAFLWTISNFCGAALAIIELIDLMQEEAKLRAKSLVASADAKDGKDSKESIQQRLSEISKKRFMETLNLFKALGDSITSTQGMGLPKQLFGFEFNDLHIGLGGLTSALVTCHSIFPAAKK